MHVSSVVTNQFEGKRWAIPARVYARSLELYAGAPVTRERLQSELQMLGYQQRPQAEKTGTWAMNGNRMLVNSRPFRFWDGEEPARALDVRFADGGIESLRERRSGNEIDLVRMEPLEIGSIFPSHGEDRLALGPEDIPEALRQALVVVAAPALDLAQPRADPPEGAGERQGLRDHLHRPAAVAAGDLVDEARDVEPRRAARRAPSRRRPSDRPAEERTPDRPNGASRDGPAS